MLQGFPSIVRVKMFQHVPRVNTGHRSGSDLRNVPGWRDQIRGRGCPAINVDVALQALTCTAYVELDGLCGHGGKLHRASLAAQEDQELSDGFFLEPHGTIVCEGYRLPVWQEGVYILAGPVQDLQSVRKG